jgi:DNA-directed RNA polymerase specialized sigma24 family protein
MSKEKTITQNKFDKMLAWLDEDREIAGEKYEKIRLSLIRILSWNHCNIAEELADEAIDIVVGKIDELLEFYVGPPELYFFGVAKRLLKAHSLEGAPRSPLPEPTTDEDLQRQWRRNELLDRCLSRCIEDLPSDDAQLIVRYYQGERRQKINNRKDLAAGLTRNALSVRVHRIRKELEKCIQLLLQQNSDGIY